ncbi:hypothetical protein HPULCUR_011184 [Helicostylum pulchrum]|uniref:Uncharacterized protein n=1 Tax=Helicostylum pulchrum TaxID=562976 RepID=A0ABP9YFC5_9FUNG
MASEEQRKKTTYKLLDEQEFRRFSNIYGNTTINGEITKCRGVGSDERFITTIQCDTTSNECPQGIQVYHLCRETCGTSSSKQIKYIVSITK